MQEGDISETKSLEAPMLILPTKTVNKSHNNKCGCERALSSAKKQQKFCTAYSKGNT